VDAEREFVDVRTLAAKVEDADLGVGHTTVEARLGVWLSHNHAVSLCSPIIVVFGSLCRCRGLYPSLFSQPVSRVVMRSRTLFLQ